MLTDICRRAAADFGDADAYRTEQGWAIGFRDLDQAADEAAAGLSARGIRPGSVVALVLPSVVDYVVLYLALARLGAITAGLNPKLRPREIEECLAVLDPALVIATDELMAPAVATRFPTEHLEPGGDAATVADPFRVRGA
ncbi:MAG: AMP-binding protein [Acidimicrobiales bacterium]